MGIPGVWIVILWNYGKRNIIINKLKLFMPALGLCMNGTVSVMEAIN